MAHKRNKKAEMEGAKVSISLRTSSKIQKVMQDAFTVEKTSQMHVDKATWTPKKPKKINIGVKYYNRPRAKSPKNIILV